MPHRKFTFLKRLLTGFVSVRSPHKQAAKTARMDKLLTDDELTKGIDRARFAYEYIDSAMLIDRYHGARPGFEMVSPTPAYFLALHGIEQRKSRSEFRCCLQALIYQVRAICKPICRKISD